MRSVRTPSKNEFEGRVFDTPSSDGTVCVASGPNTRVYTMKKKRNIEFHSPTNALLYIIKY